jgi:hypothetical protein
LIGENGRVMRGATDSVFVGTGEKNKDIFIGDYKHTKGIDPTAILQQLVYSRILE